MEESQIRKVQVSTLGVGDCIRQGLKYADMLYPKNVTKADDFFIDTFELIRFKHRNPQLAAEMDIDAELDQSITTRLMEYIGCRKKRDKEDIGVFMTKRRHSIQNADELFDGIVDPEHEAALTNSPQHPNSKINRLVDPTIIPTEARVEPKTKIIDEDDPLLIRERDSTEDPLLIRERGSTNANTVVTLKLVAQPFPAKFRGIIV